MFIKWNIIQNYFQKYDKIFRHLWNELFFHEMLGKIYA